MTHDETVQIAAANPARARAHEARERVGDETVGRPHRFRPWSKAGRAIEGIGVATAREIFRPAKP